MKLELTILGCGSSGGVPRADGDWGACDPSEPKNRRTRCCALVRRRGQGGVTSVLIDASPELRQQTAAAGVNHVDALLVTHDHADQIHGIDDLRAFFIRARRRIPAYMDLVTHDRLMRRFGYIFQGEGGYPAICEPRVLPPEGETFELDGPGGPVPVQTFDQDHGDVRSVGYRLGDLAYSSDLVDLPAGAWRALQNLELWVVDALRYTPHPTHAHLERALEWIARARPRRAVLTNLHIDMDYATLSAQLPTGVVAAYDGMTLEIGRD